MIFIINLFFSSLLYSDTNDFLQVLKQKEEQIKSLQADMELTIVVGPQGKIKQTGKYYYQAPDKLRMDITAPLSQSILVLGQKVYLKTLASSKFTESGNNDFNTKLYSSDIYGYHYLNQYVYEAVTNRSVQNNSPIEIYQGYEIINKEKIIRVKVVYNKEKGVIREYNIIGNAVIPAIRIKYGYKKISGLLVPVRVLTRIHYQMGQSDCLVKIKNIIINAGVDDQVFSP